MLVNSCVIFSLTEGGLSGPLLGTEVQLPNLSLRGSQTGQEIEKQDTVFVIRFEWVNKEGGALYTCETENARHPYSSRLLSESVAVMCGSTP